MICFNKFTWCFSFFRLSCFITWFCFFVGQTGMIPISNKSQNVCRSEPCETLWQREDKLMCLATVFGRITLLNDTLLSLNHEQFLLDAAALLFVMKFYWIFMVFFGNIFQCLFALFALREKFSYNQRFCFVYIFMAETNYPTTKLNIAWHT